MSTNVIAGQCGAQWAWSFGDQVGGSTQQNPMYAYQQRGTYTVTLLVSNSAGSNTKTQQITVNR